MHLTNNPFNLHNYHMTYVLLLLLLETRNFGKETLSHLSKITQLISGKVEFEFRQSSLSLHVMLPLRQVSSTHHEQRAPERAQHPCSSSPSGILILKPAYLLLLFSNQPGGWWPVFALCLLGSFVFGPRWSSPSIPKASYLWP